MESARHAARGLGLVFVESGGNGGSHCGGGVGGVVEARTLTKVCGNGHYYSVAACTTAGSSFPLCRQSHHMNSVCSSGIVGCCGAMVSGGRRQKTSDGFQDQQETGGADSACSYCLALGTCLGLCRQRTKAH